MAQTSQKAPAPLIVVKVRLLSSIETERQFRGKSEYRNAIIIVTQSITTAQSCTKQQKPQLCTIIICPINIFHTRTMFWALRSECFPEDRRRFASTHVHPKTLFPEMFAPPSCQPSPSNPLQYLHLSFLSSDPYPPRDCLSPLPFLDQHLVSLSHSLVVFLLFPTLV